mgnify:CR=1 FL=1
MSFWTQVYLNCDRCDETFTAAPGDRSKSELEEDAMREGWLRRHERGRRIHICSNCQAVEGAGA